MSRNAGQRHSSNGSTAEETEPEQRRQLLGIRILVVDDDDDACQMLRFALGTLGADVVTSHSVLKLSTRSADRRPHIVLTDINMPGEDGYSLLSRLRSHEDRHLAVIPAIALTAMARPEDQDRALSAGFHLHVAKPIDIEELSETIVRLIGNSAAARNGD